MRRWGVLCVLVAVLGACGDDDSDGGTTDASAVDTTTPAVTVEQVASSIAVHRHAIGEWVDAYNECLDTGPIECRDATAILRGSEDLRVRLDDAYDELAAAYAGGVPAELEQLMLRTVTQLHK